MNETHSCAIVHESEALTAGRPNPIVPCLIISCRPLFSCKSLKLLRAFCSILPIGRDARQGTGVVSCAFCGYVISVAILAMSQSAGTPNRRALRFASGRQLCRRRVTSAGLFMRRSAVNYVIVIRSPFTKQAKQTSFGVALVTVTKNADLFRRRSLCAISEMVRETVLCTVAMTVERNSSACESTGFSPTHAG